MGRRYWYLSRRLIPELRLFSSDQEIEEALRHVRFERRRMLLLLSFGYIAIIIGANWLGFVIGRYFGLKTGMQLLIGIACVMAGLYAHYNFGFRRPLQRSMRRVLRGKGIPICEACGYDLRGQPSSVCSECGTDNPVLSPGSEAG